jgi:hypothetical protein
MRDMLKDLYTFIRMTSSEDNGPVVLIALCMLVSAVAGGITLSAKEVVTSPVVAEAIYSNAITTASGTPYVIQTTGMPVNIVIAVLCLSMALVAVAVSIVWFWVYTGECVKLRAEKRDVMDGLIKLNSDCIVKINALESENGNLRGMITYLSGISSDYTVALSMYNRALEEISASEDNEFPYTPEIAQAYAKAIAAEWNGRLKDIKDDTESQ